LFKNKKEGSRGGGRGGKGERKRGFSAYARLATFFVGLRAVEKKRKFEGEGKEGRGFKRAAIAAGKSSNLISASRIGVFEKGEGLLGGGGGGGKRVPSSIISSSASLFFGGGEEIPLWNPEPGGRKPQSRACTEFVTIFLKEREGRKEREGGGEGATMPTLPKFVFLLFSLTLS